MIAEEAYRLLKIREEVVSEVVTLNLEEEDENKDLEERRIKRRKGCVRGRGKGRGRRGGRIPKKQLTFQEGIVES